MQKECLSMGEGGISNPRTRVKIAFLSRYESRVALHTLTRKKMTGDSNPEQAKHLFSPPFCRRRVREIGFGAERGKNKFALPGERTNEEVTLCTLVSRKKNKLPFSFLSQTRTSYIFPH